MTYSAIFLLLFLTAFLILAVMWCAQSILSRKPRTTAKAPRPPSPDTGTVDDALLYCSFCSKDQHAVRKLIAGPAVFICDECTARFAKRTRTASLEQWNAAAKDLPKPADIQAVLDPCLAGDAYTKRRLAITLHTYYRFLTSSARSANVELPWPKPNILLYGPEGNRKRQFAHALARRLGVPFEALDAAAFVDCDGIFERITELASSLHRSAGMDPARARRGIIYIDGIEQFRRGLSEPSLQHGAPDDIGQFVLGDLLRGTEFPVRLAPDPFGDPFMRVGPLTRALNTAEMVADCEELPVNSRWRPTDAQAALIKLITGATIWIDGKSTRANPNNDLDSIDTNDIVFIYGVTPSDESALQMSGSTDSVASPDGPNRIDVIPSREDLYRFGFLPDLIDCLPLKFAMADPPTS